MKLLVEKWNYSHNDSFNVKIGPLEVGHNMMRMHKKFELTLITDCWGKRYIGDHVDDFEEVDLVLIGTDLPHLWQAQGYLPNKDVGEHIIIHFDKDFLGNDFLKKNELAAVNNLLTQAQQGVRFYGKGLQKVIPLMKKIVKEEGLEKLITLFQIFNELVNFPEIELLSSKKYSIELDDKSKNKIYQVHDFILQNYKEKIYVKDAADICNMTVSSFCRFFKQKTGKTFFDFVKETRIGMAKNLLIQTEEYVSSICFDCGFNNLATFNKQFREITGLIPTEYRKKHSLNEK